MNGRWAEAKEGFATIKDVDEGTFVRFIEWAHKGYYTAGEFKAVEIDPPRTSGNQDSVDVAIASQEESHSNWGHDEVAPVEDDEYNTGWEYNTKRLSYKKDKKGKRAVEYFEQSRLDIPAERRNELKKAFIRRKYTVRQDVSQIPPPRRNQSPEEDYTDVFLSHARLFVFADLYDIQPLRKLALEELHAVLAIYTLYQMRTGDIVALLRYGYGNPSEPREGLEEMRTLMTQYMGYEMDTLIEDEDFRDLVIENGGPLLSDLLTMVGRRLS